MNLNSIFTETECYCLEDAMKEYKQNNLKYCDDDCLDEIDNILSILEKNRNYNHEMFKAFHNLTHKEQIK